MSSINTNYPLNYLLKKYAYKNWNISNLISNKFVYPTKLLSNIKSSARDFPRNFFKNLSLNPNLTLDIIIEYKNEDWNWTNIFLCSNLNFIELVDFLYKTTDKFSDEIRDCENNEKIFIDWYHLSQNPNITFEVYTLIKEKYGNVIDEKFLFLNDNFSLEDISKLTRPFDLNFLSFNKNLTIGFIENTDPYGNWDFLFLSQNIFISVEIITNYYPFFENNFYNLSLNKHLNINIIKHFRNENWNWFWVSENDNITPQDILSNLDLPWNSVGILLNKNLDVNFIEKTKEKFKYKPDQIELVYNENILSVINFYGAGSYNWNWNQISLNEYITFDFIEKYQTFINFDLLTSNNFTKYSISNVYCKESQLRIQNRLNVYFEELIEVSCHPNRYFQWCLDDDDKLYLN